MVVDMGTVVHHQDCRLKCWAVLLEEAVVMAVVAEAMVVAIHILAAEAVAAAA